MNGHNSCTIYSGLVHCPYPPRGAPNGGMHYMVGMAYPVGASCGGCFSGGCQGSPCPGLPEGVPGNVSGASCGAGDSCYVAKPGAVACVEPVYPDPMV